MTTVIAILYNKRKSLKSVGILAQASFKLRLSTVEAEAVRSQNRFLDKRHWHILLDPHPRQTAGNVVLMNWCEFLHQWPIHTLSKICNQLQSSEQWVQPHRLPTRVSRSDLTSLFVFSCFVYINAPNRSNIPDIFILTGCTHPWRVIQRQYATSRDDVVDYEKLNLIRRACFRHT